MATSSSPRSEPTSGGDRPEAPNQSLRMAPHDAWQQDSSLRWWLDKLLSGLPSPSTVTPADEQRLSGIGRAVGSWEWQDRADRANRNDPELAIWDRRARRIDEVRYDDSWHELINAVTDSGVCGLPWNDPRRGYLVRAAGMEMWSRLDTGVMCPVVMTTGAIPVFRRHAPDLPWAERLARDSNPPNGPHALAGMAMTEPQGGSDLGGSSTEARAVGNRFELHGHKWFVSHPMVDVLLVLAREAGLPEGSRGLSCFAVEGWRSDGSRNGIELQRLKDKLGTRSLASAEVMFRGAEAVRVGEPGQGVKTIIEMVVHTRMDCAIGSTGMMTRAVMEAISNATGRRAFGQLLIDQPLMRMVLADLVLEREGALAQSMEIARSFDAADPVGRLTAAAGKYWITRRAVQACIESVEALGGNGYTEEFVAARLYRDAQVNSTWEGSGNVMALDTLRALGRDPSLLAGVQSQIASLIGDAPSTVAEQIAAFVADTEAPSGPEHGRRFAGRIALAQQAALLAWRAGASGDAGDELVARAFCETRLQAHSERVFGDAGQMLLDASEVLLPRLLSD